MNTQNVTIKNSDINFEKISIVINDKNRNFSELVKLAELEKNVFSGQNLDGLDFEDSNLSGFDFSNTSLKFCNFSKAKIYNANFKNSNFINSTVSGTQISTLRNFNKNLIQTLEIIYYNPDNIPLDVRSNIDLLNAIILKNKINSDNLSIYTNTKNESFSALLTHKKISIKILQDAINGLLNLTENFNFNKDDENNIRMIVKNFKNTYANSTSSIEEDEFGSFFTSKR